MLTQPIKGCQGGLRNWFGAIPESERAQFLPVTRDGRTRAPIPSRTRGVSGSLESQRLRVSGSRGLSPCPCVCVPCPCIPAPVSESLRPSLLGLRDAATGTGQASTATDSDPLAARSFRIAPKVDIMAIVRTAKPNHFSNQPTRTRGQPVALRRHIPVTVLRAKISPWTQAQCTGVALGTHWGYNGF